MKRFVLHILLVLLFPLFSQAQDVTGIWRGFFVTETGENYKLEFQIIKKKNIVTGISYSYLGRQFYGKAEMSGFWKSAAGNKGLTIQELRTTEVRNMGGGGTCLMNYRFTFSQSGKELFLEGTYIGKSEDRRNPANNGKWGDCGGGKVQLRRVVQSDFYEEPFLRNRVVKRPTKTTTPVAKTTAKPPVAKTTAKPPVKSPVIKPPVATTKPPAKPPVATTKPPATVNKLPATPPSNPTTTPKIAVTPKIIPPPAQTRARANDLARIIDVHTASVTVKLYDNGEIDDDTVSVYLDNQLVLSHKKLSLTPLQVKLELNEASPEHTLVMVAENLGRIPPNTSLMVVQDGDQRYEVRITSTEQKNAMVRFRYKPASTP